MFSQIFANWQKKKKKKKDHLGKPNFHSICDSMVQNSINFKQLQSNYQTKVSNDGL